MALSNSTLAYQDCKEFLERAIDAARGARMLFKTEADAEYWRMRCNQFRKLDRVDNMQVHEIGSKMYGKSEYDSLVMTVKWSPDSLWWVYAEKRVLNPERVEDIPEDETALLVEFEEVKMIEDHSDDDKATT